MTDPSESPFARLAALTRDEGMSESEVVEALYVLRAPRCLRGIGIIVDQFFRLAARFPALLEFPEVENFDRRLEGLKVIGRASARDPEFNGDHIANRSLRFMLEPYSGDSGIANLLLVLHGSTRSDDNDAFDRLVAWFVWQAVRFNRRRLPASLYSEYLTGFNPESLLGQAEKGSRLYGASLAIRALGSPKRRDELHRATGLDLRMEEGASRHMALIQRLCWLKGDDRHRYVRYAKRTLEYTEEALAAAELAGKQLLPDDRVGRLLESTWIPNLERRSAVGLALPSTRDPREYFTPDVRRATRLTEIVTPIDGEVHSGIAIDLVRRHNRPLEVDASEDPDSEEGIEPDLTLFIADTDNLIRAYYAGKGLQNAIEYQNAMLGWAHWRLSEDAIGAIRTEVETTPAGEGAKQAAQFALGLSLLCGRSFEEVALPHYITGVPAEDDTGRVLVSTDTHIVYVRAAAPKLKKQKKEEEEKPEEGEKAEQTDQPEKGSPKEPAFYDPRATYLRLPLPEAWHPLVDACSKLTLKKTKPVVREARRLLRQFPNHLRVTEKGLRVRLSMELLVLNRGDLGLVKAITDASDVNLENLIHYASYRRVSAEAAWRRAVESMVGTLPTLDPGNLLERVGSPHGFNVESLSAHFKTMRDRFDMHVRAGAWREALNYMTMYTAQWTALATAGRRTKTPIPRIVIGRWAYVTDKHRPDESTDRLTPLTDGLIAQWQALNTFASHLALTDPRLDPFVWTPEGVEFRPYYVASPDERRPYQPKYQEKARFLDPLPGNWARKLVRAEGLELFGRMVDAGSGHFVRGRHAWRYTSTLATPEFQRRWLELQTLLEQKLGFEPWTIPDLEPSRRRFGARLPSKKSRATPEAFEEAVEEAPTLERMLELMKESAPVLYQAVFDESPPNKVAATNLVRAVLAEQDDQSSEAFKRFAEVACEAVRTRTGVPLFAVRPRPRFTRDWMVNAEGLQTFAWFEDRVLKPFERALDRLPPAPTVEACATGDAENGDRKSRAPKKPPLNPVAAIEIGRLILIAVWRLGFTRVAVLEPFLRWILSDRPILATGSVRYICIRVPCRRTNEPMRRTVFFDNFSTAYLLIERERLRAGLRRLFADRRSRRNPLLLAPVTAYLASIGIRESGFTLPQMMKAAEQRTMLNSSPILAAYASGEFCTHDLDDAELRRLAGLVADRQIDDAPRDDAVATTAEDAETPEWDLRPRAPPSRTTIPADLQTADRDFSVALTSNPTLERESLKASVAVVCPQDLAQQMTRAFALYLLDPEHKRKPSTTHLTLEERRTWNRCVTLVGHALTGLADLGNNLGLMDEGAVERLSEIAAEHFPEEVNHGAWYVFKAYLRAQSADHCGVMVGDLGRQRDYEVSAKVLPTPVVEAVLDALQSVRCGISEPHLRETARRQFDLASSIGARRAEVMYLRGVDVQGDLIQIQAYGDHTLKTAWSERVIPKRFLPPATQRWIDQAAAAGNRQIISDDPQLMREGHNFFSAVNRVIQEISGDADVGMHHGRHTAASRLLLTMLDEAVGLRSICPDCPWVESFLVERDRMDVLMGAEGPSGHGLQAISALLGHSHPTTTLMHYIHILCVAFYAHVLSQERGEITRAFERRIRSPATVQRWAKAAREQAKNESDSAKKTRIINRAMRGAIEAEVGCGLHFDERGDIRNRPAADAAPEADRTDLETLEFKRIEELDRAFRSGVPSTDPWADRAEVGLRALAGIITSKRNSKAQRHPLILGSSGIPVPSPLMAHTAAEAAVCLVRYLETLRTKRSEDLLWLLRKWARFSDAERGRMRLTDDDEIARARALPSDEQIRIDVQQAPVTKGRGNVAGAFRMRIRYAASGPFSRDTVAIRWMMTWVAALYSTVWGST